MDLRRLAAPLALIGALSTAPGTLDKKKQPEDGGAQVTLLSDGAEGTRQRAVAIADPDCQNADAAETGPDPENVIEKLKAECPDPWSMLKEQDPELFQHIQTTQPQIMKAGLDDLVGLVFDGGLELLSLLYNILGGQGTILTIILMMVFGVRPVLGGAWKLGKLGVNSARGIKSPEEQGEAIARGRLPQLNPILAEMGLNPQRALNDLEPANRAALTDHYNFVAGRFDTLRFETANDGIELFKLSIKERFLDIRITELDRRLRAVAGAAPQLEQELKRLVPLQQTILGQIAENPLNITSLRRNAEGRLRTALRTRVRGVMSTAGRSTVEQRHATQGVDNLIMVPRLYKLESAIRERKILENKLRLWEGRYNSSLRIAGPTVAAPAAGATVADQQRYQAAQAFIGIYEALQMKLRDLQDERGRLTRAAHAVEGILPTSPGRRFLATGLLYASLAYGGYGAVKGVNAGVDAIWPPEPPAPTAPSPVDEARSEDDEAEEIRVEGEAESGSSTIERNRAEAERNKTEIPPAPTEKPVEKSPASPPEKGSGLEKSDEFFE